MAGTIFGLGLSQQVDAQGVPLSGGLLYLYEASTSTPVTSYSDFALSSTQSWPLEADSAGRLPAFWLADGSYRARLTTSAGVEVFDEQSITALGASSGGSSDGSAAADTENLFQTGDMLWQPVAGTRSGWARSNGRTVGSGSSSATERANGDCQALFEYLWNNFSNTLCAVGGGRGASAEADFNANKAIATLDMRGRTNFGLDDMGNSAASVLVTGTPTAAASTIGAEKTTVAQANLPNVTFSSANLTVAAGDISNGEDVITGNVQASLGQGGTNRDAIQDGTGADGDLSISAGNITGGIPSGGSGTAATTISPGRLGTWYIKL
jgi:hypothetical protein